MAASGPARAGRPAQFEQVLAMFRIAEGGRLAAASTGRGIQIGLREPEAHLLASIGCHQGQRDKFAKILTAAPVVGQHAAWRSRST